MTSLASSGIIHWRARLGDLLAELGATLRRIEQDQIDGIEALDKLLIEELTMRETGASIKTALTLARLTAIKTIAGFDSSSSPRSIGSVFLPN